MSTAQAIEASFIFDHRNRRNLEAQDIVGDASLLRLQMASAAKRQGAMQGFSGVLTDAVKRLQAATTSPSGGGSFSSGVLNHGLVPFRRMPVFLRLVDTLAEVLDYSAGGFHVAVARGLGGGAGDSSVSFGKALLEGKKALAVQRPLNRADLVPLWTSAAAAYKAVFDTANSGPTFALPLVDKLREANALADRAYQAEGIAPPKDPGPGTVEVPGNSEKEAAAPGGPSKTLILAGISLAALVGFMAFRPEAKPVKVRNF